MHNDEILESLERAVPFAIIAVIIIVMIVLVLDIQKTNNICENVCEENNMSCYKSSKIQDEKIHQKYVYQCGCYYIENNTRQNRTINKELSWLSGQ